MTKKRLRQKLRKLIKELSFSSVWTFLRSLYTADHGTSLIKTRRLR